MIMGCDIHAYTEKRKGNKWVRIISKNNDCIDNPFDWRCYTMYAFLADVRNYAGLTPISEQRGLPLDLSDDVKKDYKEWEDDAHSCSYLTLKELLNFDYDSCFLNKRVARGSKPEWISYRDSLGENFFTNLKELKRIGLPNEVRIVFWFDN